MMRLRRSGALPVFAIWIAPCTNGAECANPQTSEIAACGDPDLVADLCLPDIAAEEAQMWLLRDAHLRGSGPGLGHLAFRNGFGFQLGLIGRLELRK